MTGWSPSPKVAWAFGALVPLGVLPVIFGERLLGVPVVGFLGLLLATGVDALLGLAPRRLAVAASVPATLGVGDRSVVVVTLTSSGRASADVAVVVDFGPEVAPQGARRARVPAGGEARLEFPFVPLRRGLREVVAVWCRWEGPLGLVRRWRTVPVGRSTAVVPDIGRVRRDAIRFFTSRDYLIGRQRERERGDGSEFESLREHMAGMDPRTIDWKASARHRRLLSQERRAERDHQVVVAVDTGRLMGEPLEGMPRLDHAVHAALLLGYVALRTGDRVGLFAFDERPRAWAAPAAGVESFARLQHATADLEYGTGETNFTLGLTDLATHLKRRSLVVVFTDFVDVVTADLMVENVSRLARRHLVVFVALRDPELESIAQAPPGSTDALYRAVTAADFVRERDVVLRRLQRMGVLVVDARPTDVSTDLVSRYLDAQRRELVG